jgi:hypothetical protein
MIWDLFAIAFSPSQVLLREAHALILLEEAHQLILDDYFGFFFGVLLQVLLGFDGLVLVQGWRHNVWS